MFSLLANHYRPARWFNGAYAAWSEGIDKTIPFDDKWHHLAMTYDSYRYLLRLYVDGEEKASSSLIWMPETSAIAGLKITSDGHSAAIDDLSAWQGALSPAQVKGIYEDSK